MEASEYKQVIDGGKEAPFEFIRSKSRNYPGMIIYLFNLGILHPFPCPRDKRDQVKVKKAFTKPAVGFSISFPISEQMLDQNFSQEELKRIVNESKWTYQVNAVFQKYENIGY